MLHITRRSFQRIPLFLLFLLLTLSACSTLQSDGSDSDQSSSSMAPYIPSAVRDIQVPAELEFNRDDSMFINTASYNGGILSFKGRVEVESLTDYFTASMQKNGWKLAGSIRYKNVLLAFVKPNKSCIIKISETDLKWKTQVYIYYTEDLQEAAGSTNSSYMQGDGVIR